MKNFKFKDENLKPVIKESVDRNTFKVKGDLPKHEDDEWVNRNNPSNKYTSPEDIESDHSLPDEFEEESYSPLTPAEDEDDFFSDYEEKTNGDELELEENDENRISNQEFNNLEAKKLYQVREAIKENKGKIGSASVSADEGRVDVFREPATNSDKFHFTPMSKTEKEKLMEQYEYYDEIAPSGKMRSEAYKDYMINSKIELRSSKKHGESHRGDNMKTLSDAKLQKQNRNVLKKLFGKWYNTKKEEPSDYL